MKGSLRILHGLNTAGRAYCWPFTLRKYRRTESGMGSLQILTVHSISAWRDGTFHESSDSPIVGLIIIIIIIILMTTKPGWLIGQ